MKAAEAYEPTHDGARILDDVRAFIARFVAFPVNAALDATTLWAAHSHMAAHFHTSPRLALLSPEPSSGKTRVLEVLQLLVPSAMFSFSASPAAIFRKLAKEPHTLLFDEVDAIFTKRGKDDGNEDIRALLNVGYRRGATIPRCVGPQHDVRDFAVFAPTALAGLGDLPDTIMSRSIIVRMRRRAPSERVEQFRLRMHEAEGAALRDRLAAWAHDVGATVGDAWPDLPDGVVDRDAEVWEPLIAVADAAGGHWPATARAACLDMLKIAADRDVSLGVRLLGDLRLVFGDRNAVATADILDALHDMDEAPWGDLYGKKLEARILARMLKRYQVESTTVKVGGRALRGYRRDEGLSDAWGRYLAPVSAEVQPVQPAPTGGAESVPDDSAKVADANDRAVNMGNSRNVTPRVTYEAPGAEVVEVAEPLSEVQPQARVQDGSHAKVAEVAPVREAGLDERAVAVVAQLQGRPREDLSAGCAESLQSMNGVPQWWHDTAKVEALPVAAALLLIAEDQRAGGVKGNAMHYLVACRAAANGATPR